MRKHWMLRTAVGAIISAAGIARADEIFFRNGDHLTGRIVSLDGTRLTVDSPSAGKLALDVKNVKTFSSDEPVEVALNDGSFAHNRVQAGPDGQIVLAPVDGPVRVVPIADVKAVNPPPVRWTGNVVLGGMLARGNTDSDSFNASLHVERRNEKDRISVDGSYILGRQRVRGGGKHESADDLLGKAKYDYFFSKKFYAYANVEAEHDVIAGLSLRLAPGVGVGYQWVETPKFSFNTEGGAGYLYRKYSHDGETGSANARAAYHLKVKFNDTVNVFHNLEYLPGLDRIDNYFFSADAGIHAAITEKFFTEFKVEYRYDSKPAPGRGPNDVRYTAGVGWAF